MLKFNATFFVLKIKTEHYNIIRLAPESPPTKEVYCHELSSVGTVRLSPVPAGEEVLWDLESPSLPYPARPGETTARLSTRTPGDTEGSPMP